MLSEMVHSPLWSLNLLLLLWLCQQSPSSSFTSFAGNTPTACSRRHNRFGQRRQQQHNNLLPRVSERGNQGRRFRSISSEQAMGVKSESGGTTGKDWPTRGGTETSMPPHESHRIAFPGGGIFFYWQIGAMSYLRECGKYDLANVPLAGASAGALASTLSATDVDFVDATELALDLAESAGVWDRPLGLQGVWGPLIERWLHELLPEDAAEVANANDRLALLVTPVPSFGKTRVTKFRDKQDLIDCNMASVHLPWFLDGKLTRDFRDAPCVDGSFLAKPQDYFDGPADGVVVLDWKKDPVMAEKSNEFVKLTTKEGIWSMVQQGKEFSHVLDERGEFDSLPRSKQ